MAGIETIHINGRCFVVAPGHAAPSSVRAVIEASTDGEVHMERIEKQGSPTDPTTLEAMRKLQQHCTEVRGELTTIVLAPASCMYEPEVLVGDDSTLIDAVSAAAAAAATDADASSPTGRRMHGILFSAAPPLSAEHEALAIASFPPPYDLSPLEVGLRLVIDGLASECESSAAALACRTALDGAVPIGDRAQVALTPVLVDERRGAAALSAAEYRVLHSLRDRCRRVVSTVFGESECYHAGALLTRIVESPTEACGAEACSAEVLRGAHVDKCNVPAYALSAVLYLTAPSSGGEFAFIDGGDTQRLVQPVAGRLLAFTSGPENPHRVCRVTRGERMAIALWFTLSRSHAAASEELELP